MSDPIRTDGVHPFEYKTPTEKQVRSIQVIRSYLKEILEVILEDVPSSRERSIAITKLEEVSMWLNKAIVFND